MRFGYLSPRTRYACARATQDDPTTESAPMSCVESPRFQLGLALMRRGEHQKAAAEFTAALHTDRDFGPVRIQRAEAYRLSGEYERALADYHAALQLDPANARILVNRGLTLWAM